MAQYELTAKQKAELRKEGHVYITRNGKQVRVTPSMVKKAGPAKRTSTGKVKARGKGRRGKIFYSPDAYNYFKGNETLSHHVTNSANVILSDGRVVTVSDNPRIYNDQLDYTAYIRGDTSKGQAVYGSTPVARRQVAETYIKNNTPKPTVLNTCDKAAMAYYDSLAKKSSSGSSRCSCSRSGPGQAARPHQVHSHSRTHTGKAQRYGRR